MNHNPKNGSIQIQAVADFSYVTYAELDTFYHYTQPGDVYIEYVGDTWSLNNPWFVVTGKTYTDKRTKKSLLDISGTITLKGTYTPANMPETRISRGSLTFKASKLDNNADEIPDLTLKGSATLANKQTKLFKGTEFQLSDFLYHGGSSYYDNDSEYGVIWYSSFNLDLNVATTGSNISGTAKAYYYDDVQDLNPNDNIDWSVYTSQYPDPEVPAKELTYSVKGTRKNGIATLNLTGQGVIKGLKATLHIDESTEEIVQNGKNSITLYGQTITY
jgi:hypothetical protein